MPKRFVLVTAAVLIVCATAVAWRTARSHAASGARAGASLTPARVSPAAGVGLLDRLPIVFEPNRGQAPASIAFLSRRPGAAFVRTAAGPSVVLAPSSAAVRPITLRLSGSSPAAMLTAADPLPGHSAYYRGADPARWLVNIPNYGRVWWRGAYKGIDVAFYGTGHQLEYDFVVAPHADPSVIRLAFDGVDRGRVDADGDLVLAAGDREVRQKRPVIYQTVGSARQHVDGGYRIAPDGAIAIEVGPYDRTRALVIDPVLVYATYLAGSDDTANIRDVAVDLSGNIIVTGFTNSSSFPFTGGDGTRTYKDAFVTKFAPSGHGLYYSVYLSGGLSPSGADDEGRALAVDYNGNAYVVGTTTSSNFPTTDGAFDRTYHGGSELGTDLFVAKLGPRGALVYSTYLGGSDDEAGTEPNGVDVAVDRFGNAYVAGGTLSTDFPTTAGSLDPASPGGDSAFLVKLNASGSGLVYGTYLTGVGMDANGVAVDATGYAYVVGSIAQTLQTTPGAFQTTRADTNAWDAYVMKLNASGSALVYSTYLGGNKFDVANAVAVDAAGAAYIVGNTNSTNFPLWTPVQPSKGGGTTSGGLDSSDEDTFVTKLDPTGSRLQYSTYWGGSGADVAFGVDVTPNGDTVVAGYTQSADFPTKNAIQSALRGTQDAFVARLDATGTTVIYSTYLGGSSLDTAHGVFVPDTGDQYVGGDTWSADFPVNGLELPYFTHQPCYPNNPTSCDEGFLARIGTAPPATLSPGDIVFYAVNAGTNVHGAWSIQSDATAASGYALTNPDAGAPKVATPLANPTDYFEMTTDVTPNTWYRLWIRGKAAKNSWANDSVDVQFTSSFSDPFAQHPAWQIGTTDALTVQIEDCIGCGLHGWGWNDDGYGYKALGPYVWIASSSTTIRVQTREDGLSIDQIVLSPFPNRYSNNAPGFQKDDTTILPHTSGSGGNFGPASDVVLWAAADSPVLRGNYSAVSDPSAAGGMRLVNPDAGQPKLSSGVADPSTYFELTFNAVEGTPYRIWVRGEAQNNYWGNDSVFMQFDNTVTSNGAPIYRIGTTSSTTMNLEDCSGCGLSGWGWQDNGWGTGVLGQVLYFSTTGPQTIRIQPREDGLSIDQIVLSPEGGKYFTASPGALKNDSTILPQQ